MDVQAFGLPPAKAIEFLRERLAIPTEHWSDITGAAQGRAQTVAGANTQALINDFANEILLNTSEGRSLAQFREAFDRIVEKHGWSYNGSRGWRSRLIYDVNMRMAAAAGHWASIVENAAERPYLRYVAILDDRTRDLHRAWHNTVLPVSHEFWTYAFPPNGWNCRCSVIQLTRKQVDRLKERGEAIKEFPPDLPKETRRVNTRRGFVNVAGRRGIDTGFDYNVGIAGFGKGQHKAVMDKHEWKDLESFADEGEAADLPPLPLRQPEAGLANRIVNPTGRPVDEVEAEIRDLFRRAIGGDEALFTDPAGGTVRLTSALIDHMIEKPQRIDGREALWPLLPELVQDPEEIWIGFATVPDGKVYARRRYFSLLELDPGKVVALVTDAESGYWQSYTFFRGQPTNLKNLRKGHLLYSRTGGGGGAI